MTETERILQGIALDPVDIADRGKGCECDHRADVHSKRVGACLVPGCICRSFAVKSVVAIVREAFEEISSVETIPAQGGGYYRFGLLSEADVEKFLRALNSRGLVVSQKR